jgi:hypothetical protein
LEIFMTMATTISRLAQDIAQDLNSQTNAIQRALQQAEIRKAEIEAQLRTAAAAYDRLTRFAPKCGDDLQCPRCWIERETSSPLTALDDGSVGCSRCKLKLFPESSITVKRITTGETVERS